MDCKIGVALSATTTTREISSHVFIKRLVREQQCNIEKIEKETFIRLRFERPTNSFKSKCCQKTQITLQ